jgi:two-component system sensor histidine kinase BaeS
MSDIPGEPRWYRSLYWRIGLGLLAFLALMLAAQGALFLWTTDRIAGSMPASSPQRLADLVASDISAALADDAGLELEEYVNEHYGNVFQAFVVLMRDGRTVANHDDVAEAVRLELRADAERRWVFPGRRFPGRGFGRGDAARGADEPPPGFGGDARPPFPPFEPRPGRRGQRGGPGPIPPARGNAAPIIVGTSIVGEVVVLPGGPPFSRVARELGPIMGLVGGGVLAVGAALIAFVVFGPVRRRLRAVQDATERVGQGDLGARAPDEGGDEVAALARSFNAMAGQLQASDRARRQLLADVSHELNTPLTAMRGYIETLAMSELSIDAATRERYVEIVMEETRRLERIIGDLLDLARLEGGGDTIRRMEVDVPALFERVAERHGRDLQSRRIELVQHVDTAAESVLGDPDRLEQAIQNLAANALRHTPDGGTITLSAGRAGDAIRLSVQDSGSGITPEQLPHIFDRFYKGDASRKSAGGSGLGLSIVKAIVERHGGTITARNDNGAVFEIALPAAG